VKTGQFRTAAMTFCERYKGVRFLFGLKIFNRFITASESVTAGGLTDWQEKKFKQMESCTNFIFKMLKNCIFAKKK
jgi:hypothetical protein